MRWRVGVGSSISIWSNPWLPSSFLPFISSPMVPGWKEATVASLIDYSKQGWKQDTLDLLFNPRDKELINSIPLCGKQVEDVLMWSFTPTGFCTVKFGKDSSTTRGAWTMENTNRMITDNGRKCGDCKFSLRSETFCGGPSRTLSQQNKI